MKAKEFVEGLCQEMGIEEDEVISRIILGFAFFNGFIKNSGLMDDVVMFVKARRKNDVNNVLELLDFCEAIASNYLETI